MPDDKTELEKQQEEAAKIEKAATDGPQLARYPDITNVSLAFVMASEAGATVTRESVDAALKDWQGERPENLYEHVTADLGRTHLMDEENKLTPLATNIGRMWRKELEKQAERAAPGSQQDAPAYVFTHEDTGEAYPPLPAREAVELWAASFNSTVGEVEPGNGNMWEAQGAKLAIYAEDGDFQLAGNSYGELAAQIVTDGWGRLEAAPAPQDQGAALVEAYRLAEREQMAEIFGNAVGLSDRNQLEGAATRAEILADALERNGQTVEPSPDRLELDALLQRQAGEAVKLAEQREAVAEHHDDELAALGERLGFIVDVEAQKADGRLKAAAPDLRDALERVLTDDMHDMGDEERAGIHSESIYGRGFAALDKAELGLEGAAPNLRDALTAYLHAEGMGSEEWARGVHPESPYGVALAALAKANGQDVAGYLAEYDGGGKQWTSEEARQAAIAESKAQQMTVAPEQAAELGAAWPHHAEVVEPTLDNVFALIASGGNWAEVRRGVPMTSEDIEANPMNAINMPLPANPSPELLADVHATANDLSWVFREAMAAARSGEPFATWQDGGPDAHEYFEQPWLNALDRLETVEAMRPEFKAERVASEEHWHEQQVAAGILDRDERISEIAAEAWERVAPEKREPDRGPDDSPKGGQKVKPAPEQAAEPMTVAAIERDPWNAVRLDIPKDADRGLLEAVYAAAGRLENEISDRFPDKDVLLEDDEARGNYLDAMGRGDEANFRLAYLHAGGDEAAEKARTAYENAEGLERDNIARDYLHAAHGGAKIVGKELYAALGEEIGVAYGDAKLIMLEGESGFHPEALKKWTLSEARAQINAEQEREGAVEEQLGGRQTLEEKRNDLHDRAETMGRAALDGFKMDDAERMADYAAYLTGNMIERSKGESSNQAWRDQLAEIRENHADLVGRMDAKDNWGGMEWLHEAEHAHEHMTDLAGKVADLASRHGLDEAEKSYVDIANEHFAKSQELREHIMAFETQIDENYSPELPPHRNFLPAEPASDYMEHYDLGSDDTQNIDTQTHFDAAAGRIGKGGFAEVIGAAEKDITDYMRDEQIAPTEENGGFRVQEHNLESHWRGVPFRTQDLKTALDMAAAMELGGKSDYVRVDLQGRDLAWRRDEGDRETYGWAHGRNRDLTPETEAEREAAYTALYGAGVEGDLLSASEAFRSNAGAATMTDAQRKEADLGARIVALEALLGRGEDHADSQQYGREQGVFDRRMEAASDSQHFAFLQAGKLAHSQDYAAELCEAMGVKLGLAEQFEDAAQYMAESRAHREIAGIERGNGAVLGSSPEQIGQDMADAAKQAGIGNNPETEIVIKGPTKEQQAGQQPDPQALPDSARMANYAELRAFTESQQAAADMDRMEAHAPNYAALKVATEAMQAVQQEAAPIGPEIAAEAPASAEMAEADGRPYESKKAPSRPGFNMQMTAQVVPTPMGTQLVTGLNQKGFGSRDEADTVAHNGQAQTADIMAGMVVIGAAESVAAENAVKAEKDRQAEPTAAQEASQPVREASERKPETAAEQAARLDADYAAMMESPDHAQSVSAGMGL